MTLEEKQQTASAWFRTLRDRIHASFEALEREASDALYPGDPGRFETTPWQRKVEDGGGGEGGMLRGRLFEKAGVHFSEVRGEFTPEMQAAIPGASDDPRFWASGVSVIAHPVNPNMPTVHMNTRMVCTTACWFGGGADLTPTQAYQRNQDHPFAKTFHAGMRAACDGFPNADYPEFKAWCDRYFHLHHRDEPRGIGGIFYDRLDSGDWKQDFAFTQSVGQRFITTYDDIARAAWDTPWTDADREEQLIQRGRYVEFNLLYDRGTMFGLKTGGNVETILSSMPPIVRWP